MTKMQSDYAPHDPDNLTEGFAAVTEYLEDAVLIAWDTCHKIYLAMDEAQANFFRENYAPDVVEGRFTAGGKSPDELDEIIDGWWDSSCSLRFINAVWSNEADPNAGFVQLVSQFAGDDQDEE